MILLGCCLRQAKGEEVSAAEAVNVEKEIDQILESADFDKNGFINYSGLWRVPTTENLWFVFKLKLSGSPDWTDTYLRNGRLCLCRIRFCLYKPKPTAIARATLASIPKV